MNRILHAFYALLISAAGLSASVMPEKLGDAAISESVKEFNLDDDELYKNKIPNAAAEEFMLNNIPRFDCPDDMLKKVYYFRWWTFRKHLRHSEDDGWTITEFMPNVGWGGKHNTISCASAHHIREARWLHNSDIAKDYITFWCFSSDRPRSYSAWFATSAMDVYSATGDSELLKRLYPKLKANYAAWKKRNFDPKKGLFWINDGADGMELSASGSLHMQWQGYRATINSYMCSECGSLSKIAEMSGLKEESEAYAKEGKLLKKNMNLMLWDSSAKFYKVLPRNGSADVFSPHRELHGYTPWYFNLAPSDYAEAWAQIKDEKGFKAPFGLTSLERRSPLFQINYVGHECQWNGPVWPYSTSITLSAMANFLRGGQTNGVLDKSDWFDALMTYAKSHRRTREDGKTVFWIDENINPFNGDWISRTRLKTWKNGGWDTEANWVERGKDYNHSTFADLIINGLVGIQPQLDGSLIVEPLAPDSWEFFAVDEVPFRGKMVSVLWDKDGSRYGKGAGFAVYVDGVEVFRSKSPGKVKIEI